MTAPSRPGPSAASHDRLLALGVLVLGLASRLAFLDADEGWFDEIFTIYTAMQPLGDVLRDALAERTNPPGYYLLTHIWGALGGGDIRIGWHRLPSALAGGVTPAILVLAARQLGLRRPAAVLGGLVAIAAPMPWLMSLEARSYALAAMLSSVALWLAARMATAEAAPTRGQRAALSVLCVGMVALHYVAALAVFGVIVGLVAARHPRDARDARDASPMAASLRRALALGMPAAIVLGGWIALAVASGPGLEGRNTAWIPVTPVLTAVGQVPGLLLAPLSPLGPVISGGALLAAMAWAAWRLRRRAGAWHEAATARFLAASAVLPLAMFLALHFLLGQRLWVPRYATTLLPGLVLLLAALMDAVPPTWRRGVAISAAAWWLVAGAFAFAERWPKPDWTRLLAALAPQGTAQLCADGSFAGLPFIYYARLAGLNELRVVSPSRCVPQSGLTWLIYEVRDGAATPATPGLILGPRIVLTRGLQDLDARRVVGWTRP